MNINPRTPKIDPENTPIEIPQDPESHPENVPKEDPKRQDDPEAEPKRIL